MNKYVFGMLAIITIVGVSACLTEGTIQEIAVENQIYDNLPDKPANYDLVKRNFYDSQISDYSLISSEIFKQPDFYPTWERSGIPTYTNHDYDRWGVHGYGFFPGEQSLNIINMSKGDTLEIYTWFHTSWGVETWQGVQLEPVYNQDLFSVQITPNSFVLGPTFPSFDSEWTHLIKFTIEAKTHIQSGTYPISVMIKPPSKEFEDAWSWDILDKFTEGKLHTDIEKCKAGSELTTCETLINLRQTKYVQGGMFTPSSLFKATLNIE